MAAMQNTPFYGRMGKPLDPALLRAWLLKASEFPRPWTQDAPGGQIHLALLRPSCATNAMKNPLLGLALLLPAACSSLAVQSEAPEKRLVLAVQESRCKTESTHSQWYALFGAIPLNQVKLKYANPAQTYRITEDRTWLDSVITVLGGALVTVTRKSVRVEACEESYLVLSPEQIEAQKEKEIAQAMDSLLRKDAPGLPGEPAFLMKDGTTRRGKIQEISAEEIVILERRKGEAEEEPAPDKSGKVARIMLMDGTVLTGEITNQTPTVIALRTRRGNVTVLKTNVRRVSYQETAAEKDAAKKKREEESMISERITLKRSEIQRMILTGESK